MVGTIWRKAEYRKGKEGFTGRKNRKMERKNVL
jgi:hypothetical protein